MFENPNSIRIKPTTTKLASKPWVRENPEMAVKSYLAMSAESNYKIRNLSRSPAQCVTMSPESSRSPAAKTNTNLKLGVDLHNARISFVRIRILILVAYMSPPQPRHRFL